MRLATTLLLLASLALAGIACGACTMTTPVASIGVTTSTTRPSADVATAQTIQTVATEAQPWAATLNPLAGLLAAVVAGGAGAYLHARGVTTGQSVALAATPLDTPAKTT